MADNIQPLNPYNTFVTKDGILTRDSYAYLYNLFLRVGGSLNELNAVTLQGRTWEAPGTLGSGVPNTGAFTTLTSSGVTDLGTASSGVILQGTTSNNDAAAGKIGEYLSFTGAPTTLTSGSAVSGGSLALTPGDWDVSTSVTVSGQVGVTNFTQVVCGLNTTTALPAALNTTALILPSTPADTTPYALHSPQTRFSLNANTTVQAIVRSVFTSGTATATVFIRARRVR